MSQFDPFDVRRNKWLGHARNDVDAPEPTNAGTCGAAGRLIQLR